MSKKFFLRMHSSRTPWSKTVSVLQFTWEKVSTSFKNSVCKELFCILLWNRMMKCPHDILLCKGEKNMWNLLHKGLTVLHLKSRYTSPVVSHLNSPNNTKRDCCRLQAHTEIFAQNSFQIDLINQCSTSKNCYFDKKMSKYSVFNTETNKGNIGLYFENNEKNC